MSARADGEGRPSAAGRLAARAARRAVHPREELPYSAVLELEPAQPVADRPGEPARRAVSPEPRAAPLPPEQPFVTPVMPSTAVDPRGQPAFDPMPAGVEAVVRPPALAAGARDAPLPQQWQQPGPPPDDAQLDNVATSWLLVDPPVPQPDIRQEAEPEPPAPREAPGWQSLAEPQPSDPRPETRAAPPPAVAAAPRVRAPVPAEPSGVVTPALGPPVAAAVAPDAAPLAAAQVPAPSGPPQVLIDRIEVITPPARPPAADPFLSLSARRVGASRHGGPS